MTILQTETLNFNVMTEILTILISIIALVVAIISILYKKKSLDIDNSRHNLSAIFDFISNEYLDRKFQSLNPVSIPEHDEPIERLRVAKQIALKSFKKNEKKWDKLTSVDSKSWENKVAFETSISLERIGISVFSGALPIRLLLLLAADQILEDYILCHYWIKSYREREITKSKNDIDFHRSMQNGL